MSIINDALKKAQNTLNAKESLTVAPGTTDTEVIPAAVPPAKPILKEIPVQPRQPQRKQNKETLLVAVTISVCVAILAGMIVLFNHIAATGLPGKTAPLPADAFIINGVMVENNKTVALINNEIFEVGETVNGKKILNITLDRIDVLENGEIKSFPVGRKKIKPGQ